MDVMQKTDPAPKARQPIHIGLLWHSASSGNLGVGALTVGNMTLAREVAAHMGLEPRFTILSMRDGDAPLELGSDVGWVLVGPRAMLSPSGSWRGLSGLACGRGFGAGAGVSAV